MENTQTVFDRLLILSVNAITFEKVQCIVIVVIYLFSNGLIVKFAFLLSFQVRFPVNAKELLLVSSLFPGVK